MQGLKNLGIILERQNASTAHPRLSYAPILRAERGVRVLRTTYADLGRAWPAIMQRRKTAPMHKIYARTNNRHVIDVIKTSMHVGIFVCWGVGGAHLAVGGKDPMHRFRLVVGICGQRDREIRLVGMRV